MKRALAALTLVLASIGASPVEIDSQYVLQRYDLALDAAPAPKAVIFTYTVTQFGPGNLDQRHVVYRSGSDVRDETLVVDGVALVHKLVRFSHREDPYAVERLAPRSVAYELLFLRALKDGRHIDFEYEATPLIKSADATVDRVTIDGQRFLPRMVYFTTRRQDAEGKAHVEYAPFGKYWMPIVAEVDGIVNGKPARERITWSDYRFPESLPPSAFVSPRPLPHATLPPV